MAGTGLFRHRVFQHPFLRRTETVGLHSVLFALLGGPIYFWRKRARLEAVIVCMAGVPMLVYDPQRALLGRAVLSDIATLVWAGSAVLAPLFLAMSYRRQGWSEIGDPE